MNLLTAASAVEGRIVGNDVDFERVVTDSRELSGGELFVALKGENFDGHEFVAQAKKLGCSGCHGQSRAGNRPAHSGSWGHHAITWASCCVLAVPVQPARCGRNRQQREDNCPRDDNVDTE